MGFLRKIWDWALPFNILYGDFTANDGHKSSSTDGVQLVSRTSVKAVKVNAGAGIAPSRDWDPRSADNPDAPLPKQSETSPATPASSNSQTSEESGRSQQTEGQQTAQEPAVRTDPKDQLSKEGLLNLIDKVAAKHSKSRKATQRDVGNAIAVSEDHSVAAGTLKRYQVALAQSKRNVARAAADVAETKQNLAKGERKIALLKKAMDLCSKGESPDAELQAELQECGVHQATIDAIGGPAQPEPEAAVVDNRSVDEVAAEINGPAKQKKVKKLAAHKVATQASSVSTPDNMADGGNADDDDEDFDGTWDCSSEEVMAEILHPYNPTAGARVPQLDQMQKGPTYAQCYHAACKEWEELEEKIFLIAKEFVLQNDKNYSEDATHQYLMFWQRTGTEKYKIDLHTPKALRDAGRCLTAEQAFTAASVWLKIMRKHMVSWIPGQEVTVVTGRGLSTGCKQFVAVGVMLAILKSQGVVARFWPISQNGAYRVVLGVPM